ncbi:alginate O-acetyltransferase AlgX-related protein [Bradyrhizobium sp. BR 10261]|uniref:alginate O-acetyltransferase AlgX-related protein n=1 Tax=Bradyrhizobium sp. BR 10261 TaxID=2749992 RepID=UPI001C64DBA6|nr:hypothetical protein [Bradyrhizobium sp. BR 10261]MBW7961802.1 hypothetical protein [Bradyrhizobium sp. BR 10261]
MPFLTDDVYEGTNGHLFLAKGSNNVIALFQLSRDEREELIRRWIELIVRRGDGLRNDGIVYRHCFVPDKLSIYREEAGEIWDGLVSPAETIEASDNPRLRRYLVGLTDYLRRQKATYEMFPKNDTHWTLEGCFSAYQMLCASLQIQQRADLVYLKPASIELSGDLGGKLHPKRLETFRFGTFARSAKRSFANDLVSLRESGVLANEVGLHVGSIVQFSNRSAQAAKRLLLFGDSFSEYRTHYLTGLLADTVSELMFVWSSNLDYRIIRDFKPDIVVTELAERFMSRPPTDDVDLVEHAKRKVERAVEAAKGKS